MKRSRVQAELSWGECKTPFFRPSCSTFLAPAASDFWPQLLLQQIFDPAARMWRSPRCTFWTTSRATFQYEEKKNHRLMSFQAKVQMRFILTGHKDGITRSRSDYVSWVMSPGQRISWVGQIRQRLLSNWNQTMFWQLSSRNLWHHPSDQTRPSVTRVTKPDQASPKWPNQTKRHPSDQTRPSVTRVTKPDQASSEWPNQTKRHPSDQTRPSVSQVTKPDQASPEWPNQIKRLPSDQTRPIVSWVTKHIVKTHNANCAPIQCQICSNPMPNMLHNLHCVHIWHCPLLIMALSSSTIYIV